MEQRCWQRLTLYARLRTLTGYNLESDSVLQNPRGALSCSASCLDQTKFSDTR